MAKILKKKVIKNQTFSALGHHRPDDDQVSQMFGFYLFNMLAHFKPKQTLWTFNGIPSSVSS